MSVITGKIVDMAVAPTVLEASTVPTLPTKPTTNNDNHDDTRDDVSKLGLVKAQHCAPICGNQSPIGGCKTRPTVPATDDSKVLDTNDLVRGVVAENDVNQHMTQADPIIALNGSNNSQGDSSASLSTRGDEAGDSGHGSAGEDVSDVTQEEQR